MPETHEIRVPELGDFAGVPVMEIPVTPGQPIDRDQTLLVVESDKATMDIPSPIAGRLVEVLVGLGDTVSAGTLVARITSGEQAAARRPDDRTGQAAHSRIDDLCVQLTDQGLDCERLAASGDEFRLKLQVGR